MGIDTKDVQTDKQQSPSSMASRLTIYLIVALAIVSMIVILSFYLYGVRKVRHDLEIMAEDSIASFAGNLSILMWNFDDDAIKLVGSTFAQGENVNSIKIFELSRKKVIYAIEKSRDADTLIRSKKVLYGDTPVGEVHIGFSKSLYEEYLHQLFFFSLITMAIVMVTIIFVTRILIKSFLKKPFRYLTDIVSEYSEGRYDLLASAIPYIEFQPFSTVLRQMGEKITIQFKELKDLNRNLERYRNQLEDQVEERTRELEVSEEKYRTLYNKSPGMMISVDVSTRKVVECNETLLEATGFSREEIIGREVFALYHPDSVETARKVFEQFLATDEIHNADLQLIKKNGETIDVLLDVTARVDKKTGNKYTLSVWRDITERKQAEALLQKAKDEAESANRAKSTFLANMSHEIRTPMNAVLGFAEILKGKEHDFQKRHYIESIHTSGKALLNLINDILDLSKIEAGKIELQYSSVSIHGLFQEMKTIFDLKITDKGVKFIVESSEVLPEALILDETRIRQVLINLIGNAAKFTDEGQIRLAAFARINGNVSRSRINLVMEVEDTGVGIPQDQQGKIFDAFEQVGGRKSSQAGGTGLGLAITRNLVAIMNGEISVSSEPGKGSTFRVTLHDVEIAAARSLKESGEKAFDFDAIAFEPATILIADDIDYNREMLATYLETWEFKILFAANGLETIDQAREHNPDLILLDMKMPEMDGYEASEIMNKDDILKNIPVIAITASAMKQSEELIAKICDGYLRKPVSRTNLIREIMKNLPHTIKKIKEEILPKEAQSTEIIFPPPDQIKKLMEAAKMGSVTDLKACISEIKDMGLKYKSFADRIDFLTRKYQFDEIIEFL
jgi:PAS domain S-box-containing protein